MNKSLSSIILATTSSLNTIVFDLLKNSKTVYQAFTKKAEFKLNKLEERWDKKHPLLYFNPGEISAKIYLFIFKIQKIYAKSFTQLKSLNRFIDS